MALLEFTWVPDGSATGDKDFTVRTAQFGDGYIQKVADGINNEKQTWPLTFTKRKADAEAIAAFLDLHKGAKSFAWKPPLGQLSLWTAGKYSINPLGAGIYRITVTFEQEYHP